jgi:hypothetical protein
MILKTLRFRSDFRQSNKTLSLLRRTLDVPPNVD